jgi:hypothetical protein
MTGPAWNLDGLWQHGGPCANCGAAIGRWVGRTATPWRHEEGCSRGCRDDTLDRGLQAEPLRLSRGEIPWPGRLHSASCSLRDTRDMDVRLSMDPLADGFGQGCCMVCGSADVSAAIMADGQIGYACHAHVRQVDAAMLQVPAAAG